MANEKRLIDANEALRMIKDSKEDNPFLNVRGQGAIWQMAHNNAIDCVNTCPTVDAVEVVHARWIKDGDVVVCSNCGEEHAWEEYRATYCEDCGAKMDGGNEDV